MLFLSGLLRLQELYQRIKPGVGNFIETVRRVDSAKEAITFLQTLETLDRFLLSYNLPLNNTSLIYDVL